MTSRGRMWGLVIVGALLVNVGLIVINAFLFTERKVKQDITNPTGVNLVTLEAPEPPEPEQVKEPEKPKEEEQNDFAPDLFQPELSGMGGLDLGAIAINLGDIGHTADTKEFVFEAYELDTPPQPLVKVPPVYPYKAREQGVQIMDARPKGVFEDAVLKAVQQWTFNPGKIEGEAVTAWVVTTIRFQL